MLILRTIAVWLIIIIAESLHGTARAILLEPCLGDFMARQVGVLTGSIIIFAIAFAFVRWLRAEGARQQLEVGFMWLILTVAFEISLGRLVMKYPWERILSDYDLFAGGLMPIGLVWLTLSPIFAAKLRERMRLRDHVKQSVRRTH